MTSTTMNTPVRDVTTNTVPHVYPVDAETVEHANSLVAGLGHQHPQRSTSFSEIVPGPDGPGGQDSDEQVTTIRPDGWSDEQWTDHLADAISSWSVITDLGFDVDSHIQRVCHDAGLDAMTGICGLLVDRGTLSPDNATGLDATTVTWWFETFIAPAVDRIETTLDRD